MQLAMAAISGGRASGTPIGSEEYQRRHKERVDKETQDKIAATEAARSAKTCCLSSIRKSPASPHLHNAGLPKKPPAK